MGMLSAPAALLLFFAAAEIASAQPSDPCAGPTTAESRLCTAEKLRAAEADMRRYLEAARRSARPPATLDSAQAAWTGYRDLACRGAAGQYDGGSLQPVVALDCRLRLTRERVLELWRAYLAGEEGLPEPATRQPA
jgi:uncharacterized protein YecT (DUF1311 family)